MPRRKGGAASPQQATNLPNKHRMPYSTRNGGRPKSIDAKKTSVKKGHKSDAERSRLVGRSLGFITPDDSGETGESGDTSHDDEGDDDDSDESDDANEVAPSGRGRNRRGHQTGLSVSFSNTKIDSGVTTRKRTWSNRAHDEDEVDRPTKTSRPAMINDDGDDVSTSDDNEGYDAVDLISESEDDDLVEQQEELLIIQSEEENDFANMENHPSSPVLEDWVGHGRSSFPGIEDPFFSEHIGRNDWYEANASTSLVSNVLDDASATLTPAVTRRVRFADDVLGNISSGEETVRGQHDFLELGLPFPRSGTPFLPDFSSDSESDEYFWDVGNTANAGLQLEQLHHLDEGNSSGYETDEGETTDEEIMTPATVNRPQAVLRLDSGAANSRPKSASSNPVRRTAISSSSNARRQGPSIGSWIADPTKPIAIVDKTGKNIIFYPASNPKQSQTRPTTPSNTPIRPGSSMSVATTNNESENERSDATTQDILFDSPANLMMSGLHGKAVSVGRTGSDFVIASPKAFFPWKTFNNKGALIMDDDDEGDDEDEEDDAEARLNIHDFIDFGDDSETDVDVSKGNSIASRRKHLQPYSSRKQITQGDIGITTNNGCVHQPNETSTQFLKRRETYMTPKLPSINGPTARRIESVT